MMCESDIFLLLVLLLLTQRFDFCTKVSIVITCIMCACTDLAPADTISILVIISLSWRTVDHRLSTYTSAGSQRPRPVYRGDWGISTDNEWRTSASTVEWAFPNGRDSFNSGQIQYAIPACWRNQCGCMWLQYCACLTVNVTSSTITFLVDVTVLFYDSVLF